MSMPRPKTFSKRKIDDEDKENFCENNKRSKATVDNKANEIEENEAYETVDLKDNKSLMSSFHKLLRAVKSTGKDSIGIYLQL